LEHHINEDGREKHYEKNPEQDDKHAGDKKADGAHRSVSRELNI
jgi:hypothetical protein